MCPAGSAISPPCRTSCPVAVWRCRIIHLPIYVWGRISDSRELNFSCFLKEKLSRFQNRKQTFMELLWSFPDLTPALPSTINMIYLFFTYPDSHTLLCFLHLYSTKKHPLSPHYDQRFCTHSSPHFPLSHRVSCPICHFVYQSSLHLFQLCYLTALQREINTISVQYSHFFLMKVIKLNQQ